MDWIDAHHHLWDLAWRDQPWTLLEGRNQIHRSILPAEYARTIAPTPVTSSVLVQVLNRHDESRDLLDLAADFSTVVGVVPWLDLTADVPAQVADLRAHRTGSRVVGIRHMALAEPDAGRWHLRPDVQRGLSGLAALNLAYDLIVRPEHLVDSTLAMESLPSLRVVLNHCAKPPVATGEIHDWARDLRQFAALPNTYCKLSGLVTMTEQQPWRPTDLRPYAMEVLEAFGPNRVMFGSDWPGSSIPSTYEQVIERVTDWISELTPGEQRDVTSGTATTAYRLPPLG